MTCREHAAGRYATAYATAYTRRLNTGVPLAGPQVQGLFHELRRGSTEATRPQADDLYGEVQYAQNVLMRTSGPLVAQRLWLRGNAATAHADTSPPQDKHALMLMRRRAQAASETVKWFLTEQDTKPEYTTYIDESSTGTGYRYYGTSLDSARWHVVAHDLPRESAAAAYERLRRLRANVLDPNNTAPHVQFPYPDDHVTRATLGAIAANVRCGACQQYISPFVGAIHDCPNANMVFPDRYRLVPRRLLMPQTTADELFTHQPDMFQPPATPEPGRLEWFPQTRSVLTAATVRFPARCGKCYAPLAPGTGLYVVASGRRSERLRANGMVYVARNLADWAHSAMPVCPTCYTYYAREIADEPLRLIAAPMPYNTNETDELRASAAIANIQNVEEQTQDSIAYALTPENSSREVRCYHCERELPNAEDRVYIPRPFSTIPPVYCHECVRTQFPHHARNETARLEMPLPYVPETLTVRAPALPTDSVRRALAALTFISRPGDEINRGTQPDDAESPARQMAARYARRAHTQTPPPEPEPEREYPPVITTWANNPAPFQQIYRAAKTRYRAGDHTAPTFPELQNTPGGITGGLGAPDTGTTFGIELEFDFPNDYAPYNARQQFAAALYEANITDIDRVANWHYIGGSGEDRPGGSYIQTSRSWVLERDASVDDQNGERGVEVKSQILTDIPDTWESLGTVLRLAREHGAVPTSRCGMHLNIGAAGFPAHNVANHERLLRLSAAYDDVLIRLAHNPDAGQYHRGRSYCNPINVPPDGYRDVYHALAHAGHYSAINLGHLPHPDDPRHRRSSRIEMRIFDSSLDLGRIQAQTALALGLAAAAQHPHITIPEPERSGTHRQEYGNRQLTGDRWTSATSTFRSLVDTLATVGLNRPEHHEMFTWLFATGRWAAN